MFRTYRISPNQQRYTPIHEIIRRRAEELERAPADQPKRPADRPSQSQAFYPLA
jgi:hypothetical protein